MGADARRVLIADGDMTLRQQLFSVLLDFDVYSDCVSSTPDALEKLETERYGVVVIDVALAGGDMQQVLVRMARMPAHERPVVLVLAANPEQARSLDVDIVQIVLRRPVQFRQLVDVIKSCIRSAAARPMAPPRKPTDGEQLLS